MHAVWRSLDWLNTFILTGTISLSFSSMWMFGYLALLGLALFARWIYTAADHQWMAEVPLWAEATIPAKDALDLALANAVPPVLVALLVPTVTDTAVACPLPALACTLLEILGM